jgi:hypothetical protein
MVARRFLKQRSACLPKTDKLRSLHPFFRDMAQEEAFRYKAVFEPRSICPARRIRIIWL